MGKHKHEDQRAAEEQAAEIVDQGPARDEAAETAEQPQDAPSPEELLRQELASMKDKYLRSVADFDNYRKRVAKDIATARRSGKEEALHPILALFDHFHMAVDAAAKADNMQVIRDGLKMVLGQFDKALGDLGVERIQAEGGAFDANVHEALSMEASAEVAEGQVLRQWKPGYKLGGTVLRPAAVIVSSGPAAQ